MDPNLHMTGNNMIRIIIKESLIKEKAEADLLALKRLTPKDKQNSNIEMLLKLGYVPIIRAKVDKFVSPPSNMGFTSELGRGSYGVVFEVVKDGKRYAAKITDDYNELEVREKIESIRKQLPKEVSRHISMAHQIIPGKPAGGKNGGFSINTKHIIVMEYLRPMNRNEYNLIFKGSRSLLPNKKIASMFKNYSKIYKSIISEIEADEIFRQISPDVEQKVFLGILYVIKGVIDNYEFTFFKGTNDEAIRNIAWDLAVDIIREVEKYIVDSDKVHAVSTISLLRSATKNGIINSVATNEFPTYFEPDLEVSDESPESQKSFMLAMKYLAENYGILWSDLHGDNIMIRPQTGDFVAADIGLFDMVNKEK